MKSTDKQLIELLKLGDRETLLEIYSNYYDACLNWVHKHFDTDASDFDDVFQDAVIVLYEAALDHKLDSISCSLKTYLFAICRNMLFSRMKLQKQLDSKVDEVSTYYREWVEIIETDNKVQVELMKKEVATMEEPCKSILTKFYYHNLKLEEIKNQMNYPNSNVVKVQKSRCLKYLREKLQSVWNTTLN